MVGDSDIAALLTWDCGSEIPETHYARLRAHPNYAPAVRTYTVAMLAQGDADPLLDGIMKDAGRNAAAMCAVYLHFSGGLTLPRIKALCASLGVASMGRARALLLYLRYLGYVESVAGRQARGPALYRATPKFIESWRAMECSLMKSLAMLEPAMTRLADRIDAPGVLASFTCFQCEGFLATAPKVDRDSPYFRVFMHSNAGIQIIHSLLAANDGHFPPTGPIPFSASAAARRFRVSRVHVSRLLARAERAGLIRLGDGGAVLFEPAGREALEFVFAMQFSHFLAAAARTVKALPDLLDTAAPAAARDAALAR